MFKNLITGKKRAYIHFPSSLSLILRPLLHWLFLSYMGWTIDNSRACSGPSMLPHLIEITAQKTFYARTLNIWLIWNWLHWLEHLPLFHSPTSSFCSSGHVIDHPEHHIIPILFREIKQIELVVEALICQSLNVNQWNHGGKNKWAWPWPNQDWNIREFPFKI